MSLRLLQGLDLEDFLEGCSHAYRVVMTAMYTRDWETLEHLVSPSCLEAMQASMEQFGDAGQRLEMESSEEGDGNDGFKLISCRLRRAQVLKPAEGVPPGACHLSVHFVAEEYFRVFSFHANDYVPPFDGQRRRQESTWVFEGAVSRGEADGEDGEAPGGAGWVVRTIS